MGDEFHVKGNYYPTSRHARERFALCPGAPRHGYPTLCNSGPRFLTVSPFSPYELWENPRIAEVAFGKPRGLGRDTVEPL